MDLLTGMILAALILLVTGGVWGWTLISGAMQRRVAEASRRAEMEELGPLKAEVEQLEARLTKLEEEAAFLRELSEPSARARLEPGERPDTI